MTAKEFLSENGYFAKDQEGGFILILTEMEDLLSRFAIIKVKEAKKRIQKMCNFK